MNSELETALRLHSLGDLSAAERIYRGVLEASPQDMNALQLLGLNLHEQGRSEEGLHFIELAVAQASQIAALHNSAGVVKMAVGDFRGAERSFRQALSLDANFSDARQNLERLSHRNLISTEDKSNVDGTGTDRLSLDTAVKLAMARGDLTRAEICLREYIQQFPNKVEPHVELGRVLLMRDCVSDACNVLELASQRFSHNVDLLELKGEALGKLNRHSDAAEVYHQVIQHRPDSAKAHLNYGVSQLAINRPVEAIASFQRALRLDPALAKAHFLVGMALSQQQDFNGAEEALRQALALHPGNPDWLVELGRVEQARGNHVRAIEIYQSILRQDPCHRPALFQLAVSCELVANPDPIVQSCVLALKRDANFAPAHLLLGITLSRRLAPERRAKLELQQREDLVRKALEHLERAARLEPSPETLDALGSALAHAGRHAEAIQHLERGIKLRSDFAQIRETLGRVLLEQGKTEEACREFNEAVRLDPSRALAHYELSRSGKNADPQASIEILSELIKDERRTSWERILLNFALAHLLDASKQYDAAFLQYKAANRLKCEDVGTQARAGDVDRQVTEQFIVPRIINVFDADFFSRCENDRGSDSDLPLFIVGMPRSGTTLVEQIIASHPDVHGAGELINIADLTLSLPRRLKTDLRYPEAAASITDEVVREMAQAYLGQLRSRHATAIRITDKMPTNFRYLGLIARLFPQARVINVRRDPLDICVSCFRQNLEWPFCDLEAIGHYYHAYLHLMEHWKSATSLRILDVQYETLVCNQEEESRRMIDFCGLPWNDACLNYWSSRRAVHTPSKWQVRQPIYGTSVGTWRRYERHLVELKERLKGRD
ncbi:tetratricopeptide repeat protein [bacterium]|nr:tetratricopeptide repeat protein [bacterium]